MRGLMDRISSRLGIALTALLVATDNLGISISQASGCCRYAPLQFRTPTLVMAGFLRRGLGYGLALTT